MGFFVCFFALLIHSPFSQAGTSPVLSWISGNNSDVEGVFPKQGESGTTFVFQVRYTDEENDAPYFHQLWIDLNGDSAYAGTGIEKFDLDNSDPENQSFQEETDYIFRKLILNEKDAPTEIKYKFYFLDRDGEAIGAPSEEHSFFVYPLSTRAVPKLTYGSNNGQGVEPVAGDGGDKYSFSVTYSHRIKISPQKYEVWIDLDNSKIFSGDEKFPMTLHAESTVDIGWTYFLENKKIFYVGDGQETKIKYKYFFTDGSFTAEGPPAVEGSSNFLRIMPKGNIPLITPPSDKPVLTPNSGRANVTPYTFSVSYGDLDHEAPEAAQVWIDLNNDGAYTEEEKFNLLEEDDHDLDYSRAKGYYLETTVLPQPAGLTEINYRFYFTDGYNVAGGDLNRPTTLSFIPNNPPQLDFLDLEKGIIPESGINGEDFSFRVRYADGDNDPPLITQIWIDLNNNGSFEDKKEKIDLSGTEDDSLTDYSKGRIYSGKKPLIANKAGNIPYKFYFTDIGGQEAQGKPTENNIVIFTASTSPPPLTDKVEKKSGCFIATAAYGSSLAPQVLLLQEFRDRYLPSWLIDFYYKFSPPLAEFIRDSNFLKTGIRIALLPLIALSYFLIKTTLFFKMTLTFFMSLFVVFAFRLRIKRNNL